MAEHSNRVQSRPIAHGGAVLRGLDCVSPAGPFEGRFGRLFPDLPPLASSDDDLAQLGGVMLEPPQDPQDDDPINNTTIPAGFTYFGQFVDHDLTFDPASKLDKLNDPGALIDFRTPRFDLDSLYGRGPDDAPFLYDTDGNSFLIGHNAVGEADLPRNIRERALLGDKRNDENLIVSQIHLAFLKYHNKVLATLPDTPCRFDEAHRIVRWHYQWIVVHDFLARLVGKALVERLLQEDLQIFRQHGQAFVSGDQPFMPVEFAVAAYRLGHSMVRFNYALNTATSGDDPQGRSKELPIFADQPNQDDLRGFRRRPENRRIEWHRFFQFDAQRYGFDPQDLQFSMNIDTGLSAGLGVLPQSVVGMGDQPQIHALALRNLRRGKALGLPSGQAVAHKLADMQIIAAADILRTVKVTRTILHNNRFTKVEVPQLSAKFGTHTPLWYYILHEADVTHHGKQLGPVGGRIVAEVFIGLLRADKTSYLHAPAPGFKPRAGQCGAVADGVFTLADLMAYVGNTI